MTLEEKDQFDALIKLANFKREVREGRRQFEWKFTAMALVALAGLSIASTPLCVTVLGVVGVWGLHTWWVCINNIRNERDRADMYHYKDLAEKMLPLGMQRDSSQWSKGPLCLCQQQLGIIQILTAYAVGGFAIAVRWIGP